jgi:cytochrome c oxidase subunit 3
MMTTTNELREPQRKRIHPHKFTLWVAMGSIIMMFAGLTSAYLVKRAQANWQAFDLPVLFSYSTAVIVASSITMQLALKNYKQRNMAVYRQLMLVTAVLGIVFIALQFAGFNDLNERGIRLLGAGSNVAGSFLAVIASLHMLHVAGGIIALLVMLFLAFRGSRRVYSAVPVEVAATYWHFVDALWIYLFVFLQMVS